MSQLSVVSSIVSFFNDGVVAVGGDFITCIANQSDSDYIECTSPSVNPGKSGFWTYGMQAIADPGIDVGFTFRVRYKIDKTLGLFPNTFVITLTPSGDPFSGVSINLQVEPDTSGAFIEASHALTNIEVQAIRAGFGFGAFSPGVSGLTLDTNFGVDAENPGHVNIYLSFVQFEAPSATPEDELDITGSGGITIGGGLFSDVIGDGGVSIGGEAVLVFNQITGTGGISIGGDAVIFANALEGTGGFKIGGAAVLVLSADISGIYALTPGFRHDVLYDGVDRLEVKIPNPKIRTAIIGN